MTDLSELAGSVVGVIKNTQEYKDYIGLLGKIKEDTDLYARVGELRTKNFQLQMGDNGGDLMDLMDNLANEYEDILNIDLVGYFLEAEAALCRVVRSFNEEVVKGLEFD